MKLETIYKNALEFCLDKIDRYTVSEETRRCFLKEELDMFSRNASMYQARAYKINQQIIKRGW